VGTTNRTDGPAGRRFRHALLALFVVAVLARIAVAAKWNVLTNRHGEQFLRGYPFYVQMAESILAGEGVHWEMYMGLGDRLASRPPMFMYLHAAVIAVFGTSPWPLVVVQSLLGGARAVFVGLAGREIAGRRVGLIAAGLAAFYPYWLGNDTTLLENTLFGALAAGGVWLAIRVRLQLGGVKTVVAAGALFGLAALTREMVGLFLPFVALSLLFAPRDRAFKSRLVLVTVLTATVIVTTSPWLGRNHHAVVKVALSTSAGRALWLGNNEHTFAVYPAASIDQSELVAWKALPIEHKQRLWDAKHDEVEQDRIFGEMAMVWIRANRGEAIRRGFRKVGALFSPLISGAYQRTSLLRKIGYTGGYGSLALLGLLGFVLGWRRLGPWRLLTLGAFGSIAAMAFVFWGQARLRAIYDFFLIVPAALAIDLILARFRSGSPGPAEPAEVP